MEPAPLVTVCLGHRCAALHNTGDTDRLGPLRHAVRNCAQAVLVSTGCLGPCALAPVMSVQQITMAVAPRLVAGPPVWLGPIDAKAVREVASWFERGGPGQSQVPRALAPMVFHAHRPGPGGNA